MYFKKEIIISFFIITISASDLYMPMIWLYLFLLDFLIPFLCGPDLQCTHSPAYLLLTVQPLLLTVKPFLLAIQPFLLAVQLLQLSLKPLQFTVLPCLLYGL
jgi:hypothetical protein